SYNIPSTNLEEIGSSNWAAKLEDLKLEVIEFWFEVQEEGPTMVLIIGIVSTRVSVLVSHIEGLKTNKSLNERPGVPIVEKETIT
ncbi:27131_t:CDS:2, partial [Racocetra persica]